MNSTWLRAGLNRLRRRIAEAAPAQLPGRFRVAPHPQDVAVDYARFCDSLFV